jgi:hypothetical protein
MEQIIKKWDGSGGVDVHVLVYEEEVFPLDEKLTKEQVHDRLKECLGDHLKTFSMIPVEITAQDTTDFSDAIKSQCRPKLERLLAQNYALYLTAQQVQRYMLKSGVKYDYILKFRPDLIVREAPLLLAVEPGTIVNIRATYDFMYWSLQYDGSRHTGFSDIAGYGRASDMWTYLNIHNGLKTFLTAEPRWDWSNILDIDHDVNDLGGSNRCDAEGLISYWLGLSGMTLQTDWRWNTGILREDGHINQGYFTCQWWLQPSWLCPPETYVEYTSPTLFSLIFFSLSFYCKD